jgi:hypothetical protein
LVPQLVPVGFTVTVPVPVLPAVVPYIRLYVVVVVAVNVAVTAMAAFSVTVHELVVLVQPTHFVKVEPVLGVAVRVTVVPAGYVAQFAPQLAPAGFTVTVPVPVLPVVVPYVRLYVVVDIPASGAGIPASGVGPARHCLYASRQARVHVRS